MIKNKLLLFLFTLPFFSLCVFNSNHAQGETAPQSLQEQNEGYYYFEGIFLSYDEVIDAAKTVSDEYPRYSVVPEEFHVTTEFLPSVTHEDLYGTEVSVHITGYQFGTATDPKDGTASENEGFRVEVQSENPEMQELLDSIDKKWHLSISYTNGAKYTEYMDFSDADPVSITLTGKFGRCDSNGKLMLEKE